MIYRNKLRMIYTPYGVIKTREFKSVRKLLKISFLFIQAAGLAYHRRAKRGAYHHGNAVYLITRQRAFSCGLMIYNAPH